MSISSGAHQAGTCSAGSSPLHHLVSVTSPARRSNSTTPVRRPASLGRDIGFPHCSLPPAQHCFCSSRTTCIPSSHPVRRHAPLYLLQRPVRSITSTVPALTARTAAPNTRRLHRSGLSPFGGCARKPGVPALRRAVVQRSTEHNTRAETPGHAKLRRVVCGCSACNTFLLDLHPPTAASRVYAPRTNRHHVPTPERRRARDRRRFRQSRVVAFRRRPYRPRRHPALRLCQGRAGHLVSVGPHHSVH